MCTDKQNLAIGLLATALALVSEGNVRIETNKQLNRVPQPAFRPNVQPVAQPRPCTCKPVAAPKPFAALQQKFNQEPDGVQIVVDRPRIENYGGNRQQWAMDMANYRQLIDQAKKCDHIKTRKPDWIPEEVHNNRRDWYDTNEPINPRQIAGRFGCPTGWGW